jgi:hypothetical protein
VDGAADQLLMVYTPGPGSAEHDAIRLLASWSADTASVAHPAKQPGPADSSDGGRAHHQ